MVFFYLLSVLINTVICYDLMWILYNPFKSPELNMKISLTVCFLFAFIVAILGQDSVKKGHHEGVSIVMTVAYSVFLIFAVLSVAYSWCRMKGSLFSKEVKLLILKRHITYIVAYAILNSFCILASIWSMMKQYGTEEMEEWVDR